MADNQSTEKMLVCDNDGCDKTFKSRPGKWKHMKKCEKRCRQNTSAVKEWTKNDDGTIKCNKCDKSFTQLVNFYRHN